MPAQLAFGFVQEIDDRKQGIVRIEGWPVLNTVFPGEKGAGRGSFGFQSGWIHRRWYPHAEDALVDARKASALYPAKKFYVIQFGSQRSDGHIDRGIWPEGRHWAIREQPPFHGVTGAYYTPKLDYYVLLGGVEFLEVGESQELARKKSRKAREEWEGKYGRKL